MLLQSSDIRGCFVFLVTANIRSRGNHFLTAGKSDIPILGTSDKGSAHPYSDCTYKVKRKPLFDGWFLGVLKM